MQQSPVILDLCLRTTRSGKSRDCREAIDRFFLKSSRFKNCATSTRKRKAGVFKLLNNNNNNNNNNNSSLRSVFEKLRFLEGLVWTVGLTFLWHNVEAALKEGI